MAKKAKEVDEWQVLVPGDSLVINGVTYKVPPTLALNSSFFLPTLNSAAAFGKVMQHYRPQGYKLAWNERIEQDTLGIRVWRVA